MGCGCSVHDCQSDICSTRVFGDPTPRQRTVRDTVRRDQETAPEAAFAGTPVGKVDDVIGAFYDSKGFGTGYRTPGLPQRLGHGTGMDGQEPA